MKKEQKVKEKSVFTSLTGISSNQFMSRKSSFTPKENSRNNFSQKSSQNNKSNSIRQNSASSPQALFSRRYATLTADQQINRRQSKKSRSFANQIYFPHGNFAKIRQKTQQKPIENATKAKLKTQTGIERLHCSLETIDKNRKLNSLNVLVHRSQTQGNENSQMSFLQKLNLERRSKIMEIYRPKPQQDSKSRKISLPPPQQINFPKKSFTEQSRRKTKEENQKQVDGQSMKSKQSKQLHANSQATQTLQLKNHHEQQSQEIDLKPSLITHQIIEIKDFKIDKKGTQMHQREKLTYIKPQFSHQNPVQNQQSKLFHPKYTQFYDNYILDPQFMTTKVSIEKQKQSIPTKHSITNSTQQIIRHKQAPIISAIRNNPITPRITQKSQTNLLQNCSNSQSLTQQNLKKRIPIQKIKSKIFKSNTCTPQLNILNDFLSSEKSMANQNFRILKINSGTYFGQINSQNHSHGLGVIFYKSGKLFEGHFIDGSKSGQGLQIHPDGSFFLGRYLNGMKNGKGRFQWSNGEIYDGEWKDDKKHGSGQWKAQNGISYVGEWKQNRIQGFGVLIQGQQRYEGQFINFSKNGHGTYRYQNGQVYTGNFRSNRLNGNGQYYWPNGDHYKGEFMNNKRHGKGVLYLGADKILYRGEFRNDKKCGLGEQTYQEKVQYVGNFENDLKHGWGILKRLSLNEEESDEVIYQGYWVNNQTIEMSETPVEQFGMIEQVDAEYLKNQLSKSNLKVQNWKMNEKSLSKNQKTLKKNEEIENRLFLEGEKQKQKARILPQTRLKPQQSVALKGRSRYMRMNNHYIQKSILPSNKNSQQKSIQNLAKSKAPTTKTVNKDKSNQSISRHRRQCF